MVLTSVVLTINESYHILIDKHLVIRHLLRSRTIFCTIKDREKEIQIILMPLKAHSATSWLHTTPLKAAGTSASWLDISATLVALYLAYYLFTVKNRRLRTDVLNLPRPSIPSSWISGEHEETHKKDMLILRKCVRSHECPLQFARLGVQYPNSAGIGWRRSTRWLSRGMILINKYLPFFSI